MGLGKAVKQYLGVLAINPPDTIIAQRAPTSGDTNYRPFQIWMYQPSSAFFMYTGAGVWVALGSGSTGSINTITGTTGGALSPTAGNINILGTANQLAFAGSGSTLTASLSSTLVAPGSVTATTTLTATAGAITATNGNLVLGTAGNKLSITTGANASIGVSGAMTAGTITISTTAVTASSKIFLTHASVGGTVGTLSVGTITAGTSFVINSSNNADTSTVNWWIIN